MPSPIDSDLLLVTAQLSVTFAGFAGLASVLGHRGEQDDARVDAGRLINMLVVSLSTAMLALVPFVPMLFRVPARWAWGSSAVIALLTMALVAPGLLSRAKRMEQYTGFNKPSNVVNLVLGVLAALGFTLCALGFPVSRLVASYFTGLIALLVICAILFFRVIASLLRPHSPDR